MSAAGMTATVIATELAQAVMKDQEGDGCDVSAGLYGPSASAYLRELAAAIVDAAQTRAASRSDGSDWLDYAVTPAEQAKRAAHFAEEGVAAEPLVEFFRGEGVQFGLEGDAMQWTPERTAVEVIRRLAKMRAYQGRVGAWMDTCFPRALWGDMTQRCDRFLEEALELLQAQGYDRGRVATLVDYVWGRPVGDPRQEVGGTVVTLAALCWAAGIDMQEEADRELTRIELPEVMAKIQAKQQAKNALHFDSPLPGRTP